MTKINISDNHINIPDNWYTVSGLIITSLSFLLGVYFVYAAIRAYEQIKKLEITINEGTLINNNLSKQEKYQTQILLVMFDKHIDLLRRIPKNISLYRDVQASINSLELEKARMSINIQSIKTQDKLLGLYKLAAIGEIVDLELIKGKYATNYFEKEVNETVSYIIKAMTERLIV